MKRLIALMMCSVLADGMAQFIPQPTGYNPDENGDQFISVSDLQGILSLYGLPFQTSDSLIIESIDFPQEYGLHHPSEPSSVLLDEEWDMVYLNQTQDVAVKFYLPVGLGYKVMQVLVSCESFAQLGVTFYPEPSSSASFFSGSVNLYCQSPRVFTFIRGHNGKWYAQDSDNQ